MVREVAAGHPVPVRSVQRYNTEFRATSDMNQTKPRSRHPIASKWHGWHDHGWCALAKTSHPLRSRSDVTVCNMVRVPCIVVSGAHSGVGKTSIAVGLMAALQGRGLRVQPFKVGPDFLDPMHHEIACGSGTSCNLDGWMLDRPACLASFERACTARDADFAVVEGVMGLFDSAGGKNEDGSTAQMAKWLGAPTVFVVDAWCMARSAAALVHGYASFDPDLEFAGDR